MTTHTDVFLSAAKAKAEELRDQDDAELGRQLEGGAIAAVENRMDALNRGISALTSEAIAAKINVPPAAILLQHVQNMLRGIERSLPALDDAPAASM